MPRSSPDTPPVVISSAAGRPMRDYIPTLDGWRAVAIVIVILCHGSDSLVTAVPWLSPWHALLKDNGMNGVRVFFGISGFLITVRLLAEMDESRPAILSRFYIRRGFRILAPAILFLLVLGILALLGFVDVPFRGWWASLLFMGNYVGGGGWYTGHFWSLAIEEHFYLLWPGLLLFCRTRRSVILAIGIAGAVVFWRAVCYYLQWGLGEGFYARTDTQLDGLLWGAVAAFAYARALFRNWLQAALRAPVSYLLLLLLGVSFGFHFSDWKARHALYAVQAFSIPLVLLATVLNPQSAMSRGLEAAPLRWLGRISYSLYLWQQLFFVFDSCRSPSLSWLQQWPTNLGAALGCATLSYHLVERPLIRVGARLAQGRDRKLVNVAAEAEPNAASVKL